MRRVLALSALAVLALVAGCSGEFDPIVGTWVADGEQPSGHSHFAEDAEIRVEQDGTVIMGTAPSSLCGGATVTALEPETEHAGGDTAIFQIVFPADSGCLTVDVPMSLEVTVDGDTLEALPTGVDDVTPYRFRRSD